MVKDGRTVGITGQSHAIVHNLINAVFRAADECGEHLRIAQRADDDNPFLHHRAESRAYGEIRGALGAGQIEVAAGTTFMWARPEFAASVDNLFVDEAGQMSLANVLAIAGGGRNLVLLGDPQQLAQPSHAAHPPGWVSALEHVLGGKPTMPQEAGLFMDVTWRLHPDLCSYTSQVFYDGRLTGVAGLEQPAILGDGSLVGSGLRVIEVAHVGNANDSPEEA